MAWDFSFDPETGDTVSDGKGSIVTTESAETQVMLQLRSKFAAWWGDPTAGSKLADLRSLDADPVVVQAEAIRTLNVLAARGVIDHVTAAAEESPDVTGRVSLTTTCRDTRTGRVLKSGATS